MKKSYENTTKDIETIPKTSGLYYFFDKNDNLLYVGKAKNLKLRIQSHQKLNFFHREGLFLRKITISKGWQNTPEEWPKQLKKAWMEFNFKGMSQSHMIVIDYIFHRIKRITIDEFHHEFTEAKEMEEIQSLKPPFNFQTASEKYYQIQENLE